MFSGFRRRRIQKKIKEGQEISPEETLLDSWEGDINEESRLELPIPSRNFFIFFLLMIFFIGVGWLRLLDIQLIKADVFQKKAEQNRILERPVYPIRGIIYDQDREQLVFNLPRFSLVGRPLDILSDKDRAREAAVSLGVLLEKHDTDFAEKDAVAILLDRFSKLRPSDVNPRIIIDNIDSAAVSSLEEGADQFSGLWIEQSVKREYKDPLLAGHLLGFIGRIDSDELLDRSDYFLNDFIGKAGIEKQYEDFLRGSAGKELREVDFRGNILKEYKAEKPRAGKSLVLSIDWDLQKILGRAMKKGLERVDGNRGIAVALNPQNGHLKALLSFPSFNANTIFSDEEFKKVKNNKDQPLFNRVISGLYPPGSTIKPIIGAAAMEENIISAQRQIFVTGSITVPNKYDPNVVYTFRDWKPHGLVDFTKALAVSSNVYFYTVGGGYKDIKGLGIDKIKDYAYRFGLGTKLGIDIPGEKVGLIPDPLWKKEIKGEEWYIGDTYNVSIGQGDVLVTPIEMISAIAAIANGGTLYQPRIVLKILSSEGEIIEEKKPVILEKQVVSKESLELVKRGMREAVLSGSARRLNYLSLEVAGKTGTAEAAGQEKPNAWFVSFAPYENPELALVIMIEEGGEGSSAAVPIAEEVYKWMGKNN